MPPVTTETPPTRRALLSVSDKTGLVEFARRLHRLGFELVSTGGTATALRQGSLPVRDVADITDYPEMLDGRVKTLHPRIHGGLLGQWHNSGHQSQMRAHGIAPIEIAVVNLYPFEHVAARPDAAFAELIENIDIGGPAMVRSAAKNFASVAIVTDPADYEMVASELEAQGKVPLATRWRLAQKAFRRTAAYDAAIATVLAQRSADGAMTAVLDQAPPPTRLQLDVPRQQVLRYGENPHQQAGLYPDPQQPGGVAHGKLLHGKELSYNNLVDLDAAWQLAREFSHPAVAIIKHTNPAGCASADSVREAYELALACDPVSAYGGVIGVNRPVDEAAAEAIAQLFVECIAAPSFTAGALARLTVKRNLRLLEVAPSPLPPTLRSLTGGYLVQSPDATLLSPDGAWRVVTERTPSPDEERGLRFAWIISKHVKSNAIVFARAHGNDGGQTLAVGAGQMSRVDSVKIAALRAQLPLQGAVVASDAYFPFPDGIEAAVQAGAAAVVQPGGSVRDDEAIATCNRLGVAMVFTGMRHFRH